MEWIRPIERIFYEQGARTGEGIQLRGERAMPIRQMALKFGSLPEPVQTRLAKAKAAQIARWRETILDADSLAQWPDVVREKLTRLKAGADMPDIGVLEQYIGLNAAHRVRMASRAPVLQVVETATRIGVQQLAQMWGASMWQAACSQLQVRVQMEYLRHSDRVILQAGCQRHGLQVSENRAHWYYLV
jgi:hypothetical protein